MIRLTFQVAVALAACLSLFVVHACLKSSPPHTEPDPLSIKGEPSIRVRLSRTLSDLRVEFTGGVVVRVAGVEAGTNRGGVWPVHFDSGTLQLGPHRFTDWPVELRFEADRFTLHEGTSSASYRGTLRFEPRRGELLIVNELPLEAYLAGVLGREMSVQPGVREALKAQVIAARTYALYEMSLHRQEPFHLFDDERSQVYGGIDAESEPARTLTQETRGRILLFRGRLVPAFYSSTCGGHTEPAWEVLPNAPRMPPLRGTSCGFCTESPAYEWEARIGKKDMAERLFGREGKISGLKVSRRGPGGHAFEIEVLFDGVNRRLNALFEFRMRLGPQKVRSTRLTAIEEHGDGYVLKGRGWGHGAGMCQWGAYGMAKAGRTAAEILEHYFPGARVRKLY